MRVFKEVYVLPFCALSLLQMANLNILLFFPSTPFFLFLSSQTMHLKGSEMSHTLNLLSGLSYQFLLETVPTVCIHFLLLPGWAVWLLLLSLLLYLLRRCILYLTVLELTLSNQLHCIDQTVALYFHIFCSGIVPREQHRGQRSRGFHIICRQNKL